MGKEKEESAAKKGNLSAYSFFQGTSDQDSSKVKQDINALNEQVKSYLERAKQEEEKVKQLYFPT